MNSRENMPTQNCCRAYTFKGVLENNLFTYIVKVFIKASFTLFKECTENTNFQVLANCKIWISATNFSLQNAIVQSFTHLNTEKH